MIYRFRSSSPLPSAVSGKIDDLNDPDGEGATAIWRTSSPPTFQPFRELKATTSSKEMPSEPPLFVTVAHFCMFGAAEEGVMSPTLASGDVDDGHAGNLLSVGGGGAVTPSVLPSLFPQGSAAGCTLSEGVKMVLSSGEHEGGTALGGCPSPGMFSLHSVVSEDVIVKVLKRNLHFQLLLLLVGYYAFAASPLAPGKFLGRREGSGGSIHLTRSGIVAHVYGVGR